MQLWLAVVMGAVLATCVQGAQGAQCMGEDGQWYDYSSPQCGGASGVGAAAAAPLDIDLIEAPSAVEGIGASAALLLRAAVLVGGYRCDTISMAYAYTGGYSLSCNQFRYKFAMTDRGGKWEVKAVR